MISNQTKLVYKEITLGSNSNKLSPRFINKMEGIFKNLSNHFEIKKNSFEEFDSILCYALHFKPHISQIEDYCNSSEFVHKVFGKFDSIAKKMRYCNDEKALLNCLSERVSFFITSLHGYLKYGYIEKSYSLVNIFSTSFYMYNKYISDIFIKLNQVGYHSDIFKNLGKNFDLSNTTISNHNFAGDYLVGCFKKTVFRNCLFDHAILEGNFTGAKFENCRFPYTNFKGDCTSYENVYIDEFDERATLFFENNEIYQEIEFNKNPKIEQIRYENICDIEIHTKINEITMSFNSGLIDEADPIIVEFTQKALNNDLESIHIETQSGVLLNINLLCLVTQDKVAPNQLCGIKYNKTIQIYNFNAVRHWIKKHKRCPYNKDLDYIINNFINISILKKALYESNTKYKK